MGERIRNLVWQQWNALGIHKDRDQFEACVDWAVSLTQLGLREEAAVTKACEDFK